MSYSKIITNKIWYWEETVPNSYEVIDNDKVWFYSKNQNPDGYLSNVSTGVDHNFQMIGDLSDGSWSAGSEPIGNSSGILIAQYTWNLFNNWCPKTTSEIYADNHTILSGSKLSVN